MFDAGTRADVRHVAGGLARATADQPQRVGPAVRATADTLQAAHGLLADLGKDQRALDGLVRQGSVATATLAAKRPVIEDLLTVAGTTFREFGTRSAAIRASLDEFAPALRQANGTLVRVDGSLGRLDGLVADLRPALRALRPFIGDARPALAGLRGLAPATARTLATLTSSAPSITRFTRAARRFSAPLRDALSALTPQLACVRPYGPDIAAFLTTWASWGQDYDDTSHYARVKAIEGPTSLNSFPPIPTDTFLGLAAGGLKYAMPRPPGLNAGKPDYLAQCGAGREATDPSKDPEDRK
jgi:ABC-type transporter Mla subunit MlaD